MTDFYLNSKYFLNTRTDTPTKPLTLDDLRNARERMLEAVTEAPVVYCHPLQYPFYRVLVGGVRVMSLDLVIRWHYGLKLTY